MARNRNQFNILAWNRNLITPWEKASLAHKKNLGPNFSQATVGPAMGSISLDLTISL